MKNIIEKIRKSVIAILTFFSLLITLLNYLNLHIIDIFNSNHFPRTYSILLVMIWLYILILGRKKIYKYLKKFSVKNLNKENICIIIMFIISLISLYSIIKIWCYDYFYTKLLLFAFFDLVIVKIEFEESKSKKEKLRRN